MLAVVHGHTICCPLKP